MAEDLFQGFCGKARRHPEHAFPVKTAIRGKNMKMVVDSEEIGNIF